MDWSDKTAQAKVWFESLRDQICAEFESIERDQIRRGAIEAVGAGA